MKNNPNIFELAMYPTSQQVVYPPVCDPRLQLQAMANASRDYNIAKKFFKDGQDFRLGQDFEASYQIMLRTPFQSYERIAPRLQDTNLMGATNFLGWDNLIRQAQWVVSGTRLDPLSGLTMSLVGIVAALQGRIKIDCGTDTQWLEPTVLRGIISAQSAAGKSTAFGRILSPFIQFQDYKRPNTPPGFSEETREIAIALLKETRRQFVQKTKISDPELIPKIFQKAEEIQYSGLPRLINPGNEHVQCLASRFSQYALLKAMEANGGSSFLATAEPQDFFECGKNYSNDFINKSFNQEYHEYITAKDDIRVPEPALNILIGCQTELTMKHCSGQKADEDNENGKWPRFMFLMNPPNLQKENYEALLNGDEAEEYNKAIVALLNAFYSQSHTANKHRISLDASSLQIFREFVGEDKYTPDTNAAIAAWVGKLGGLAARLAAALHFWRYGVQGIKTPVNQETMQIAIGLARALHIHAHFLFSENGIAADYAAARIHKLLSSLTEVQQQVQMERGVDTTYIQQRTKMDRVLINATLYHLRETNWCALLDEGSGKLVARFRPKFYDINAIEPLF